MRRAFPTLLMFMMVAGASDVHAHVTVQPKTASAKGLQEFLVRVPTEKNLPTTSVKLVFPEGFDVLRVRPAAGWKYELEKDASGRVTSITWSGSSVGLNEYEVFSFMARAQTPGNYKINAYQTYGANDVVAWVNDAEPRPAPQIMVEPAPAAAAVTGADPFAGAATRPSPASEQPAPTSSSNFSMAINWLALLMSVMAVVISWRSSRRSKA